MLKNRIEPTFTAALPETIDFRCCSLPAGTACLQHTQRCGEFIYAFESVIEITTDESHYLSPSHYGVWLPPDTPYSRFNRCEASYCSIYIDAARCHKLPTTTCIVPLDPLVRALLQHLRHCKSDAFHSERGKKLLLVVIKHIAFSSPSKRALSYSGDPVLVRVLNYIEANIDEKMTLIKLASLVNMTPRTLIRRSRRELGMSLTEWRQRFRLIKALSLLEQGQTIESIAYALGYSTSSAFIVMFRKVMGITPTELRKINIDQ